MQKLLFLAFLSLGAAPAPGPRPAKAPVTIWAFGYAQGFNTCYGKTLITNVVLLSEMDIDFSKVETPNGLNYYVSPVIQKYFKKQFDRLYPDCTGNITMYAYRSFGVAACKTGREQACLLTKEECIKTREKVIQDDPGHTFIYVNLP